MQKVTYYTNAALAIQTHDVKILCDPWLTGGAFHGSWFHYPPLQVQPEDLTDYTHLYISHIHPDHCDVATLSRLPNKNVPVIIPTYGDPFLRKRIERAGFTQFIELKDGEKTSLSDRTSVTLYQAFTASSLVADAEVPNIIDSSLLVDDGDHLVFNINDNTPTPEVCARLRERHGRVDLALMPYSGVGPYPSCYENLSDEDKAEAAKRKKSGFLQRMEENLRELQPKFVIPVAGTMILAGEVWAKQRYIGVPSPSAAVERATKLGFPSAELHESDVFDVATQEVHRAPVREYPDEETFGRSLSGIRYWWQDSFKVPTEDRVELGPLLSAARERMWRYQQKFGFTHDSVVVFQIDEAPFQDHFYVYSMADNSPVKKVARAAFDSTYPGVPYLRVTLSYALLIALLTRHCHWNNVYHGCLVNYCRQPDVFRPEIQTLMSYLHL